MQTLFRPDWREVWGGERCPESGAIYTRGEVVELILDLAGYGGDQRLSTRRLLEPSCGEGAFLLPVIRRLIAAERRQGKRHRLWDPSVLDSSIVAVDISEPAVLAARQAVAALLVEEGCSAPRAHQLARGWIFQTDFLLHDWGGVEFDFVVGNPPYVRLEDMPVPVLHEYRAACATLTDRADLYVAFLERGLSLLGSSGVLAFICSNRFAKNHYGAALRHLIARQYHVRHYLNLEHTQPFLTKVSAYPAIVVLDRQVGRPTFAVSVPDLAAERLAGIPRNGDRSGETGLFPAWYPDGGPWVSTCRVAHQGLQDLAARFPTLEASAPGTRVGIGVATGADRVFVLPEKSADIEASRQLPLLMATDIKATGLHWSGRWLLNPFADEDTGALVTLSDYPGMAHHLEMFAAALRRRHCAKKRATGWYRTIDRIWHSLVSRPKLVIPDIQPGGIVGFDAGRYYPHHNVYWVTSRTWNLRALQTFLRSAFVTEQVRAHSVAMRGGSLRYQAQNLRRVRLPAWAALSNSQRRDLAALSQCADQDHLDRIVSEIVKDV